MIGFVNVYKPRGVTSFKIVGEIKKIYGIKHVGHLGTLDPMAEGVLPIAIGKATKFFDYFLKKDKEYIGRFEVGYATDSLDAEGEVIDKNDARITLQTVQQSCQKFMGKIRQIPPKFSAIKINGQRAYKLAREGKEFEIKPKEVEIYALSAHDGEVDNSFDFKIWCSAGTYIRSLGVDILNHAGVLSTMIKLVRTRSGSFKIEDAKTIDEIKINPVNALLKVENVLPNIKLINLDDNEFFKIKNGATVRTTLSDGEYLAKYLGEVVALVEVSDGQKKCKINLIEENN